MLESRNKFGRYCVPSASSHRNSAKKILDGEIHEPLTLEYIQEFYPGGDIIHAGAYFGDFLPFLSSILDEGCYLWAFEPNPENFYCAKKTIEINGLDNVFLMNIGLADSDGFLQLQIVDKSGIPLGGGSRFGSGGIDVPVDRLDNLISLDREIGLIHLDIEEFEGVALRGAKEILLKDSPVLVLETVPAWILDWGYEKREEIEGNTILCFR